MKKHLNEDKILEMYREGKTSRYIAKELGVSKGTILNRLNKMEVSFSKKPEKDVLYKKYVEEKKSSLELANELNTTKTSVLRWLKEYDISTRTISESCIISKRKEIPTKEELIEIAKTHDLGMLQKHYEVGQNTIYEWYDYYGISRQKHNFRSRREKEIYDILLSFNDNWKNNVRDVIPPYELDAYNEDLKIAVEVCGSYWHSSERKHVNYHQEKWKKCKEKDIKLITLFESDSIDKIKNLFSEKKKIYARKCKLIEIKNPHFFHKEHHFHGTSNCSESIGLEHEGELVAVCSLSKSRYNKSFEMECSRLTFHSDFIVIGGASKLFKHFMKKYDSIITYADLRFGNGKVYEKCGFTFSGITKPNYFYFKLKNSDILYSRIEFQKHKLKDKLENFDENLTEYENMLNHGYYRIYDCGNSVWTYKKSGE